MDHEFAGDPAGNLKYQHSSGGSAYSGSRNNRGLRQKIKDRDHHFPEYDWTRAVLGDREADVDLTMLLDNGTDLHSFQPAVKDIMKVSSCDLLIYVGGESDQWIEDALESAQNKDMKTINLMEVLGDTIKEEENVEACRKVAMDMKTRMRRNTMSMSGHPSEMRQ